jgi:hypothetical protein
MKKIIFLVVIALFMSSGIAFGKTTFKIQGGEYFQHLSSSFSIGTQTSTYIPTTISTSDIGLSNHDDSLYVTAILNSGGNRLSVSYNPVSYSGSKTLDETINYDGNTYNLNDKINSKISLRTFKLFYFYNFSVGKYVKFGPGIGIDNENISVSINDITTNQSAEKTIDAPIPLLAADVIVTPIRNLSISGRIQGLAYSGNSYYFLTGKVEYDIQNRYSVFAEYAERKLTLNISNIDGSLTFSGPIVGVGVKF